MKVDKLKTRSLLVIPAKAGVQHLATCRLVRMATLVGISLAILFSLFAFVACTDYVAEIDDQIKDLKTKQAQDESSHEFDDSAEEISSSSDKVIEPAEVTTGTLTDSRDGQTYKTVTIGTQTWMAENLNYETANSYCYNDSDELCDKYGRLYTWAAAVGKSEDECGMYNTCPLPSGNIQSVCPNGWHLPSTAEWETLFNAVGGQSTAGKVLKSQAGWYDGGNGTDAFGFSALPAGNRDNYGDFYYEGSYAYFWSSTEYNSYYAYHVNLGYGYDNAALNYYDSGLSVRCLQD